MELTLYQVDAFTRTPFAGNPAAVCVLEETIPDELMQSIANEMNLSETAFVRRKGEGGWHLRWFTPTDEVDLCGLPLWLHHMCCSRENSYPQTRRPSSKP